MYPDTDLPPLSNTQDRIDEIEKDLPEFAWKRQERYKDMGLSNQLILELFRERMVDIFDDLAVQNIPVSMPFLARTLAETTKSLRRRGIVVDNLREKQFDFILKGISMGYFAKEATEKAMAILAEDPAITSEDIIDRLEIPTINEDELENKIDLIIDEHLGELKNRDRASRFLMGKIMHHYRGSIDGSIVKERLEQHLQNGR
jgi:aspartyl-tRNA(Asn)/glutamyl-tRNA(Gln) amidotransferase subunit B